MFEDYSKFKSSLFSINEYLNNIYKENNIKNIDLDNTLTNNKKEYLNNYIYNAIVNHADYLFKSKSKKYKTLNEDDILREIILKEFKKHQNQTRYNILENYFTNTLPTLKYKNKHRIINAEKNKNDEMEEAQKEFSKLFKVDSYENNRGCRKIK